MVEAVEHYAAAVRAEVCPDRPMALGLRLSAQAAEEADERRLADLRRRMEALGLYARSINAFPYGRFHGTRVKERVYAPDWRTQERLAYTLRAAEILTRLLPKGDTGCLSTVPVSYRAWTADETDVGKARTHLRMAAEALARLRDRTGRFIGLALEPEPDCWIETEEESLAFLSSLSQMGEAARHLGVCLDTCHLAVVGRPPLEAVQRLRKGDVPIFKIQVSAAPVARNTEAGRRALAAFADEVYLHQTCALNDEGRPVARWPDLPEALGALGALSESVEVRTHAHVPLHWTGEGAALGTTATQLGAEFWWEAVRSTADFEIETYTFDVLPAALRVGGVVQCIAAEYRWAQARLASASEKTA